MVLGHVEKYAHVVKALAPLASISTPSKIVSIFQTLHPSISLSPRPHSLMDFQQNGNLELSLDSFRSAFLHMSHFSSMGPFGMVFEHLCDAFDLKNSTSGFIQLHQLSSHVGMGHFLGPITCVLGVVKFLALVKPLGSMRPIAMSKILY